MEEVPETPTADSTPQPFGNILAIPSVLPVKKPESQRLNSLGNINSGLPEGNPDPNWLGRREIVETKE